MDVVFVTGAAGFIGSNVVKRLLDIGNVYVIGIDNMNDYYDVSLKEYRLNQIKSLHSENFRFIKSDISNRDYVFSLFEEYKPDIVINLAAQAGVRYSITNPDAYIQSNVIGFYNILEACRKYPVKHLIYASSSSVYGGNTKTPFSESDKVDGPVSLYAATKKSNELFAHTYSKLYGIPTTGLRFFTVYGPAGRPDMAYFSFTDSLLKGKSIKVFNNGNCVRDFTYIDDITDGIMSIVYRGHIPADKSNGIPYNIYNIGRGRPENLIDFISILYQELRDSGMLPENYKLDEHLEFVEMQAGDVQVTYSDTSKLGHDYQYFPKTDLREGLHKFVEWYKEYKEYYKQVN